MLRFPNRVAQTGVYHDDPVNYLTLSSGNALTGMRTFATAATAEGWDDGDLVGVLVSKQDGSYAVWTGQWNASAGTVTRYDEEALGGSFTDADAVEVRAVASQEMLRLGMTTPEYGQFVEVSGTSYTAGDAAAGKVLRCTSASAVTITLDTNASVSIQGVIVREGAGSVSIQRGGTDTVNGGTTAVSIPAQWKSAYFYQYAEGAWVVVV